MEHMFREGRRGERPKIGRDAYPQSSGKQEGLS